MKKALVLAMTLTLKVALVVTKVVHTYRISLAHKWILAKLFVYMTTGLQTLLVLTFGQKMDTTDLAITIAGAPFP